MTVLRLGLIILNVRGIASAEILLVVAGMGPDISFSGMRGFGNNSNGIEL